MSGEYIKADTADQYWKKLKTIYESRSLKWKDLTKKQYEAIEKSEREDSDNHINKDRLGKDTKVIDICHYKTQEKRTVSYHIEIINEKLESTDYYFQIQLRQSID